MLTRSSDIDALYGARARTLFRVLLAGYVGWSVLYIFRSSIQLDGARVFVLWDDAMVSMRYAKNLAAGQGLVWFPGAERVQGFSNLGVTLLMAAIHLLPIDLTRTSLVFQLLNLALLTYCAFLARAITRSLFQSEIAGVSAAACLMASGPVAVLSLQGTDVGVVAALLLTALHIVVTATKDGGLWPSRVYVVLGLGILVRLDFALVYLTFALASLLFPRPRLSLLLAVSFFALTTVGILAFQHAYYGNALPNTYYLKATGSPINLTIRSGLLQQRFFIQRVLTVLSLTSVVLYALKRHDRRIWLLGMASFALFAYDVGAGGDWIASYTSRFFAPALPLLLIAAVGSAWTLLEQIALTDTASARVGRPTPRQRLVVFVLFSAVAALSFNTDQALREWVNPRMKTMLRDDNLRNLRTAKYLREHSSRDATLAVHWAGMLPYFLERETIDVLGKTDRHIARMVVPIFQPGHSKWDWQYIVQQRRPDFIDFASRGLDRRPDFLADYVRTTFDGDLELYVRKDAVRKLHDPTLRFEPIVPSQADKN